MTENVTENSAFEDLLGSDQNAGLSSEETGHGASKDQGEATVTNDPIEIEEDDEKDENLENEETKEEDTEKDNEEDEESEELPDYSDNALYSFLQDRGVSDPSKIKMQDENGDISEYDFNSLTVEEQRNILKELTDPGISDYEASVINLMRKNNATLEDIVEFYSNQKLEAYLKQNPDEAPKKNYSIDEYSDDELYVADLKTKFPTFTDEELLNKLDSAKENENLFKKEVDSLREMYKAQEDSERKAAEEKEQQAQVDLRNNLANAVSAFNEITLDYNDPESDSLVIEDEDKEDIMSYLLDQDADGLSQFVKDVNDPATLIELAWFRTKGADVLSGITKYWKDELKKERKESAKLRHQIEKTNKKNASVVVQPTTIDNSKKVNNMGSV